MTAGPDHAFPGIHRLRGIEATAGGENPIDNEARA
jgi:hypothetical protein